MWQAEADTELTLSASPTTAVGQKALALAKRRYSTVLTLQSLKQTMSALCQLQPATLVGQILLALAKFC